MPWKGPPRQAAFVISAVLSLVVILQILAYGGKARLLTPLRLGQVKGAANWSDLVKALGRVPCRTRPPAARCARPRAPGLVVVLCSLCSHSFCEPLRFLG